MARRSKSKVNETKESIISTAWDLFYEKGYENTTVDEIVEQSHTSKGSFYHYFKSKDSLLSALTFLFDGIYDDLENSVPHDMNPINKMILYNKEIFQFVENKVPVSLLTVLFSRQLVSNTENAFTDPERVYFKTIRRLAIEAQKLGYIRDDLTVNDVVIAYGVFERGLMYDWCMCNANYSLCQYSQKMLPMFIQGLCKKDLLDDDEIVK